MLVIPPPLLSTHPSPCFPPTPPPCFPLAPVCLPPAPPQVDYKFTSLDKTTISNIPPRSPRLWAHAVITWVVSFFVYMCLWK